jgi:winged helix DNA-binding protein
MAPEVVGPRARNRALLARQGLLERLEAPLPRALERVGGLQAQYAPSMYVGLWSRVESFERNALTRALERRTVVQATLMRTTIHLVSRRDFWPLALAVREARRRSWLRTRRDAPPAAHMAAAAARLREALRDGPLPRAEVERIAGRGLLLGIGLWLDLVRVPPSGTWERRRADLFAAAEDWIGPPEATAADGAELLVRRYLGGFGPASRHDLASFTGLGLRDLDAVLDGLALRRGRDEAGGELLDLPRAPRPDPETPAPVRYLPTWDATLLVHARGAGVLAEEHRPRIFHVRNPHSSPTFLVDGAVAGTWRHEQGRIVLQPFGRLARAARAELDEEAERLAALHA